MKWDGRYQEGAAYSSGEYVEQFFSYLSRYSCTTKYMSASSKQDVNVIAFRSFFCSERRVSNRGSFFLESTQDSKFTRFFNETSSKGMLHVCVVKIV